MSDIKFSVNKTQFQKIQQCFHAESNQDIYYMKNILWSKKLCYNDFEKKNFYKKALY